MCKDWGPISREREGFGSKYEAIEEIYRVTWSTSLAPKPLPQFGHFRSLDASRSSIHVSQNTWPQTFKALLLKLRLQMVHSAIAWLTRQ